MLNIKTQPIKVGRLHVCFIERFSDAQEALKILLGGPGSSTSEQLLINMENFRKRIKLEMQQRITACGSPIISFSAGVQLPSTSANFKAYNESEKKFHDARYQGNVAVANKPMGEGSIDVNAVDFNCRKQPFIYAACRGPNCQPAIVELLLRQRASTKVAEGKCRSLPVRAFVINVVDCTHPSHVSFIPQEQFDECFERLAANAGLLKVHNVDFNSINAFGHSAFPNFSTSILKSINQQECTSSTRHFAN